MRRSNRRRAQRKKRIIGAIVCCVPLVLGSTVWFGLAHRPAPKELPSVSSISSADHADQTNYTTMVISCNQIVQLQENDRETIVAIQTQMETLMREQPVQSSASYDKPGAAISSGTTVKAIPYWITFSNEAGQQQVYEITGNHLVDHSTNQIVELSSEQLKQLLVDLGVSNPK